MTPSEAAKILAAASAFDGRDASSEAAARLWSEALHDIPADPDTFAAVTRYYSDSTGTEPGARRWMEPHHLRTTRRKIRAERLDTGATVYDGNPNETPEQYLASKRRQLDSVASGLTPPRPALTAIGPRPAPATRLNYDTDDIRAMRADGDLGRLWRESLAQAGADNDDRKRRVLAHPDLAEQLTQPPVKFDRPECWTGYLAPERLPDGQPNRSPIRAQLAALVAEADRRAAHRPAAA